MANFTVIRSHDYGLVDRGMLKDPKLSLEEKAIITCVEALKASDWSSNTSLQSILGLTADELDGLLKSILSKGYLAEYIRKPEDA